MTANAPFNAFSYPGIALPGKAEPIKKLSEVVIIHVLCNNPNNYSGIFSHLVAERIRGVKDSRVQEFII